MIRCASMHAVRATMGLKEVKAEYKELKAKGDTMTDQERQRVRALKKKILEATSERSNVAADPARSLRSVRMST